MTRDLGDAAHPDVATPGRWRLLGGSRRLSRATTVAPVDEDIADLNALALQRMLDNAENRLLTAQAKVEAVLAHLADRRRWSGMTAEDILSAVKSEVFEVHLIVTGKAKK